MHRVVHVFGKGDLRDFPGYAVDRHLDVYVRCATLVPAWIDRRERDLTIAVGPGSNRPQGRLESSKRQPRGERNQE